MWMFVQFVIVLLLVLIGSVLIHTQRHSELVLPNPIAISMKLFYRVMYWPETSSISLLSLS